MKLRYLHIYIIGILLSTFLDQIVKPIYCLAEIPQAIESVEFQEGESKEEKNLDDEEAQDKLVTKKNSFGLSLSLHIKSIFFEKYTLSSIESNTKDYPPEN